VSPGAIAIAQQERKNHPDLRIQFQVADVMHLPLEPSAFDVVCMSGSLSCIDVPCVMQCVHRYLKPDGAFIAIDTYGYNPFLNLKRIINYYFLKKTTKKTLHSIPKKETLSLIASGFETVTIDFYGIFAFVGALVRPLLGKGYTTRLVDALDAPFPFLKKYAFKFVLFAHNKKQHGG
jgi:SAM-dependent methyltransferase